jgi:hypothetical protein
MNQQTELHPAATPCSQEAGTGPAAAQAITVLGVDPAQHPDSTAVLQFVIRPDEIIVTALLVMGTIRKVEKRWRRRTRNSWALAGGPPLFDFQKAAISPDVADSLDRAGVPSPSPTCCRAAPQALQLKPSRRQRRRWPVLGRSPNDPARANPFPPAAALR